MKEKDNTIKISFSTFLLVIAVLIIIIMGIFMYKIYNDKNTVEKRADELNVQVENLKGKTEDFQQKLDTINNTINEEKTNETNATGEINEVKESNIVSPDLTESQKKSIFNEITSEKAFLQEMVGSKDFNNSTFSDKEILKLLTILDAKSFKFDTEDNGDVAKANIKVVQELAQKYFGKTLDVNKLSNNIKNDVVTIDVESGYGIVTYKLDSITSANNNQYKVKFIYEEDEKSTEYTLTIEYKDNQIKYISIEK